MPRGLITLMCLLTACDSSTAPGSFPPEDPELAARNEAAGDPWRGRFPFEEAVAGLPVAGLPESGTLQAAGLPESGAGLPESGTLQATIVTEVGEIHCRLYADIAPLAVANFVGLARGLRPFLDPELGSWTTRPFYDGLTFHRAVQRQFVQGGRLGEELWVGFTLQDERSIGTVFDRAGMLALANPGKADSSAAEFFITTEVLRSLDGKYTIIGRCEDPLVVRELEAKVLADERPRIETVRIERVP